ncbi:MAG: hypothetical protein MJ198_04525, partial [Bacteroidales bacterium]|nr:hypothetical protein [Bacteroidales bacterium]
MKRVFTTIAMVLSVLITFAQAPQKMSYQAVVRNSSGNLVSEQEVPVIVSILQNSEDGDAVYTETHNNVKTNKNGLISLEIGEGIAEEGNDFEKIDWSDGPYFIMTQVIVEGQPITITSELLSVPYAMFAEQAGSVVGMENYVKKNEVTTIVDTANLGFIKRTEYYSELGNYVEKDYLDAWNEDKLTEYAKKADVDDVYMKKSEMPEISDLSEYAKIEDLPNMAEYAKVADLDIYVESSDLSTVATSGSY